jgi:hypothetical protein
MLNRGDRTIISICEEAGVLLGTGAKWISEAQGKAAGATKRALGSVFRLRSRGGCSTNLKDEA